MHVHMRVEQQQLQRSTATTTTTIYDEIKFASGYKFSKILEDSKTNTVQMFLTQKLHGYGLYGKHLSVYGTI